MALKSDEAIEFADITGARFSLSLNGYHALLRHPGTRTFLLLAVLLLISTDPPNLTGRFPLSVIVVFWPLAVGLYFCLLTAVLTAAFWASQRRPGRTVPLPVVTLAALVPAVVIGEFGLYVATGTWIHDAPSWRMAFYPVSTEALAFIFVRFVMPGLIEAPTEKVVVPDPPARRILIGSEPVALARLRHVEAREHHVHVTLDGQSVTHRARLSDIVAQTRPEDGVQPHRSWWVARGAAARLTEEDGRPMLETVDGCRIPVARARVPTVRDWLDEHAAG